VSADGSPLGDRAAGLRTSRVPYVHARVVLAERPTSAKPGDEALVLADGTIEGFVGGVCTQASVRAYSMRAIETGEALLLRVLPEESIEGGNGIGPGAANEEGAVTIQNTCLSGGGIEVFLEPVLPAPRVLVVGETPIAAAILALGPEVGLDLLAVTGASPEPAADDLALVVASHGRDELHVLRRALEAGVPYVGLVASSKRGAGVLADLRADGVPDEHLARIDVPAGLDIGAQSPAEIALSILVTIVGVRRGAKPESSAESARPIDLGHEASPTLAIDPICGMTVAAVATTPSVEHEGETVYFCCEGCASAFVARDAGAVASE
jgi:xanthine dehydrogenase accessory factor